MPKRVAAPIVFSNGGESGNKAQCDLVEEIL